MNFGFNVFDFGAKGDGVTDDTAAIQSAIDFVAKRGGGKILFPFTPRGYRIASPAVEEIDGKPVRSQLVIPAGFLILCSVSSWKLWKKWQTSILAMRKTQCLRKRRYSFLRM